MAYSAWGSLLVKIGYSAKNTARTPLFSLNSAPYPKFILTNKEGQVWASLPRSRFFGELRDIQKNGCEGD